MIKTKKLGSLVYLGNFNVARFHSYKRFKDLLSFYSIPFYEITLSSKPGRFGGGKMFSDGKNIYLSTYSKLVRSRVKGLKFYVYTLIVINKSDFEKIKHILN
jgi:hypothetical protein